MFSKKEEPKSVFITGASSGLGAHLAIEYANKARTLHLCGRNKERLNQTAITCKQKGAKVFTYLFDTTDEKAAQKAIQQAFSRTPLDLVIANAGVSAGVIGMPENSEATRKTLQRLEY